jgi:retron-type reverse transcriptase
MASLDNLKAAVTLGDLAALLKYQPSSLSYLAFKYPSSEKYRTFEIPKQNGGARIITAPNDSLKVLQQKLSVLLQDCLDEINMSKGRKDRVSHGFKRQRSIITNAREHRNRRYVFNIDLKNFFPSINFGRVRGYFIKDNNFKLNEKVATVIAQVACYEDALPQGSPCSPVISNLVTHVLDMHLVRLAASCGCTYSRYADDLTFSTNKKDFPDRIAKPSEEQPHIWKPGAELLRLIKHSRFEINPDKTHMQYRTSRQIVTGLIVNRRINVRHEYRHAVRAMVHSLLMKGSFTILESSDVSGAPTFQQQEGTTNQLHGMLGFIDKIDLENRKHSQSGKVVGILSSKEQIYRRFLIYQNFFAAEMPVVLCEGETDNIYLTHAIRGLSTDFPEIATIDPNGKIQLNLRLFKYRHSSTGRILGLRDGGTGSLSSFIATYKKETARFHAPGEKNPIIIVYDNDAGAHNIRNAVKTASGKPMTGKEDFVHVIANLYALPTPLNGAAQSKIEDFFERTTKAAILNGKAFDDSNDLDSTTHYGKKAFAQNVVRPNAHTISFNGFRPLLTSLVSVIRAHAANASTSGAITP